MKPEANYDNIDRALVCEDPIVPSSGFADAVMARVMEASAAPQPIPFPWMRALPGIALAVGVLGWGAIHLARFFLAAAREIDWSGTVQLSAGLPVQRAGWIALALVISLLCWLYSRRLAGQSGML